MLQALKWLAGAAGYWTCFALAAVLFASAVLTPEWSDHQRLVEQRELLARHVRQLRNERDRLAQAQELLPTDPVTTERLARLQLGYRRPGEMGVWVPDPVARPAAALAERRSVHPAPPQDGALGRLLAAANRPKSRTLMLTIASALLLAAIILGLPTRPRKLV